MEAVVWSDYICPWCYVGLDRTDLLGSKGVRVRPLPFELHPDLPPEGRTITDARTGGRTAALYDRIEAECAAVGLPFRRPKRIPNSRRALEAAVVVAQLYPNALDALHRSLFTAHFVDGVPIDDPDVLDHLVATAGADAPAVTEAWSAGLAANALDSAREAAYDAGATGTPSWWLDGRALIAGLQPRRHYQRVVEHLLASA